MPHRCMTGMTSTGVQAVQFGLGLAWIRLGGMHVHTGGYPRPTEMTAIIVQRTTRILNVRPGVCLSAIYRLI
jgi:hypothetical protein